MPTGGPPAATLKGTEFSVCAPSKLVGPVTGLYQVSVTFAYGDSADEGSMASIENQPLACFFQHVFFCFLARGLLRTIMWTPWALFQGDEGLGRRYEADTSYGLLGSRHKNSDHRACPWARIVYVGIWRWTLAGAASGVVRAGALVVSYIIRTGMEVNYLFSYLMNPNVLNSRFP
jgi:hypothetical protein